MKKILRTRLVYNCEKREDFDYVEREWKTVYDRSFDMYVSASTKEECERVMESFEDAIAEADIQNSFDSNLAPEYDEKKKIWVGAVEVYVGNDYVADEKEAIMEVYREWKQLLKTTPVAVEAPATVETVENIEVVEAPATIEKNNSEFLIREIKNLSSGTILSIARESGFLNSNTVTWLEIEALEQEWIEFVEKIKDSSENWKQSWKKFSKYKDDMLEAWINDEEFQLEDWLKNEGFKSEEITEESVSTGYKPQKERVAEMIDKLELEKEYTIDDNAGTKMTIIKNKDRVLWGAVGVIWNDFNTIELDYQEYILKLVLQDAREHKCEFEYEDSEIDTENNYDHDKLIKTTYYRCKKCGRLKREVSEEKKYYNEEDWR